VTVALLHVVHEFGRIGLRRGVFTRSSGGCNVNVSESDYSGTVRWGGPAVFAQCCVRRSEAARDDVDVQSLPAWACWYFSLTAHTEQGLPLADHSDRDDQGKWYSAGGRRCFAPSRQGVRDRGGEPKSGGACAKIASGQVHLAEDEVRTVPRSGYGIV
jgi:hypothetical protein